MLTHYADTARALKSALAHAVSTGSGCILGRPFEQAGSELTLAPDDAHVQAGFIRRHLERLNVVDQALLIVAYAPKRLSCACRRPCCSGHYANPEWSVALSRVVADTATLLSAHKLNVALRQAIIANLLTHQRETNVSLAQRCGAERHAVGQQVTLLQAHLMGTRHSAGRFDDAFGRIDARLREAKIVVADVEAQAA
jgi:hypothetical protein